MTSLEKIFKKCEEYNIFPNLDETFCYTPKRITKYSSKYIGSIYSKTDINEIAECISEEGSCMLCYVIESKEDKEVKITNIFISLLIEYGFDPYVNDMNNVNIIITDRDILNEEDEENDSDYDYEDEENDTDGEKYDYEDEEDEEDGDAVEDVVEDVVEVVEDEEAEDDVEDVVEDDVEDVVEDVVEVVEDEEAEEAEEDGDVVEDVVEDVEDVEDGEVEDDVEDVVEDVDNVVEDEVEDEVGDDVEDVEEDAFEKLKYISTLTKVHLLNLLLDNKIYEYKTKNIRKLNKTDMQDCAREFIKKINL